MLRSWTRKLLAGSMVIAAASTLSAGCAKPAATGLVLAFSADVKTPNEMTSLEVEVERSGSVVYFKPFSFIDDSEGLKLPATLTLQKRDSEEASDKIIVRLKGLLNGKPVYFREHTVNFAEEKVKLMRLHIDYSCYGLAKCQVPGQTCLGGTCQAADLSGESLPDYNDNQVFGTPSSGTCFNTNTTACRADLKDAPAIDAIRAQGCEFDAGSANINVFAHFTGMADADRLVVLTKDTPGGWTTGSGPTMVKLPASICEKSEDAEAKNSLDIVKFSTACEPKTEAIPVCLGGNN